MDDDERKVFREAVGQEPSRLSCNELSSREIEEGVQLGDAPLFLRHKTQIGIIFDDAYDKLPGQETPMGVYIYAAIPLVGANFFSRLYLATKLLMADGSIAEACDLSTYIQADFLEGRAVADDKVRKTLQEVSVLPEKNGNRPNCTVTRALLVSQDGSIISSIPGGE